MSKIKNQLIDRMIEKKLTKKEIDFLLYIIRYQDGSGKVNGVHYKDVCDHMKMSYQGFYDVKKALIDKGFIHSVKSNRIDHDIMILNNEFLTDEDFKEGFVSLKYNLFYDPKFYKMKAGAKLLSLKFLELCGKNDGEYVIGIERFLKDYSKLFHVSKRVMSKYLSQVREFFIAVILERNYIIKPRKETMKKPFGRESEHGYFTLHNVEVICRRNRIKKKKKKALNDVRSLWCDKYKAAAERIGKDLTDLIAQAVETSIERMNAPGGKKLIRDLQGPFVHKILREELGIVKAI